MKWMPENTHRCCCQSEMIRDVETWEEDKRHHAFSAACQQTALKLVEHFLVIAHPVERGGVVHYWISEKDMEQLRQEVMKEQKHE